MDLAKKAENGELKLIATPGYCEYSSIKSVKDFLDQQGIYLEIIEGKKSRSIKRPISRIQINMGEYLECYGANEKGVELFKNIYFPNN